MNNRDITFLGLIRRAGFLEVGDESVNAVARRGRARVILSAADASDNSKRRASGYARTYGTAYARLPWTKEELRNLLGRGEPAMLAVTDSGMAKALLERLERTNSENHRRIES